MVCREAGKGKDMEKMVSLAFYIETTTRMHAFIPCYPEVRQRFGSVGLGFKGQGGRGSGCRVYASGVEAFSV